MATKNVQKLKSGKAEKSAGADGRSAHGLPLHLPERKMQLDAAHCWLERSNPLSSLSIRSAQSIFDAAREGDTQRLHWLYQEIEAANPILFTCIERRQSALAAFLPKISVLPSAEGRLGEEQKDAAETFLAGIENFTDLLEHLDSAFFRGFALAQPIWEADGTVREVVLHNSWEFLVHEGETWHNPECTGWDPRRCVSCADAGLVGIQRRRAIDYPALAVHIRHAVSERDWGRFLERYALPKPAVTMAPNATTENRADYLLAAKAVENGQVSVWPNGTGITDFAGGSRGTDPFNSFIDHQEKLVMLLATGGTLTSLAQADTGSLAGGAQFKVWREIVARDSIVAAQAIMRSLLKPYLQRAFGARPCAISLALEVPAERNAKEAAELAATLRNAGWSIDQAELEKATGFTLEKAPNTSQPHPFATAKAQTALQTRENPLQNAAKQKDAQSPAQDETAPKSQKNGLSRLEEEIASIIAGIFADEVGKAAHPVEKLRGSEVEKLRGSESVAAAHASEQPRGKTTPESTPGSFAPAGTGIKAATKETVEKFKRELPDRISADEADALLTAEFDDVDGDGNIVKYGALLLDHINRESHSEKDRLARKHSLGTAVKMIRQTKPIATNRAGGKERMYAWHIGDKAYVAVADEHNEIGAFIMVSYRRDGKHDKK